jgi:hypothetical protein
VVVGDNSEISLIGGYFGIIQKLQGKSFIKSQNIRDTIILILAK